MIRKIPDFCKVAAYALHQNSTETRTGVSSSLSPAYFSLIQYPSLNQHLVIRRIRIDGFLKSGISVSVTTYVFPNPVAGKNLRKSLPEDKYSKTRK